MYKVAAVGFVCLMILQAGCGEAEEGQIKSEASSDNTKQVSEGDVFNATEPLPSDAEPQSEEEAPADYKSATQPKNALSEKVTDALDDVVSPGGKTHEGIGLMGDEEGKTDEVSFGFAPDGRLRPADGTVALMLTDVTIEGQAFSKSTRLKRVDGWWVRLPATTGPVTIIISQEQMDAIKFLPEDVVCLTSARNPVTSLDGLEDDEFASWPTGPQIPQTLMAAFGREDTVVGLRIIAAGHEEADFNQNNRLRLFITHEPYVEQLLKRGGVRIEFRTQLTSSNSTAFPDGSSTASEPPDAPANAPQRVEQVNDEGLLQKYAAWKQGAATCPLAVLAPVTTGVITREEGVEACQRLLRKHAMTVWIENKAGSKALKTQLEFGLDDLKELEASLKNAQTYQIM